MDTNFLTTEQVAERLKVTPWTVRQWLKAGTIPGVKINRSWRVRERDLAEISTKTESISYSAPQPREAPLDAIRAARGSMSDLPFSLDDYLKERQSETDAEEGVLH